MKHMAVWITGKVEGIVACPVGLECLWTVLERRCWRSEVGKSVVIHIFRPLLARCLEIWCLGTTLGWICQSFHGRRWLGRALDSLDRGRRHRLGDRLPWLPSCWSWCDVNVHLGLLTWHVRLRSRHSTDPLRLPVLVLRLFTSSLHVGSRVVVVASA